MVKFTFRAVVCGAVAFVAGSLTGLPLIGVAAGAVVMGGFIAND